MPNPEPASRHPAGAQPPDPDRAGSDLFRENPPWLFGLLSTPDGVFYWGVSALLIPYLMRKYGVGVDRIAEVVAFGSIPNIWSFVASPIVDLGFTRRFWIVLSAVLKAACGVGAILSSAGAPAIVAALLFAGNVSSALSGGAIGALLSTVNPKVRGRASGWMQAGNIGAGSLAGGAAIWLADRGGMAALISFCVFLTVIPGLGALRIFETARAHLKPLPLFQALGADVWDLLRAKRTWLGLLFFLSPVGAGALGNLISSVGPDYHASGTVVAWISGAAGGALLGLGSVVGGFICDRMHRMTAYALFGMMGGLCAAWLGLGHATAFTYSWGYAAYSLCTGFAYAAFVALILEVIGKRKRGAATCYSLMSASGNVPLVYMTWLDGAGYHRWGVRGLMGMEAAAGIVGGILLLMVARYLARRSPGTAAEIAPVAV